MTLLLLTIFAGTLISEDLACISAGLLVHDGILAAGWAVSACVAGIYGGDVGLWLAGRWFGRRALAWRWVGANLSPHRAKAVAQWLDDHCAASVLGSRFIPGTRLPTYVAAGIFGRRAKAFLLWALAAVLLWTPTVVLLVAVFGRAIKAPLERALGVGRLSLVLLAGVAFVTIRILPRILTEIGRARLIARFSRIWRWEFWPAWIFYAPLLPWLLVRSLFENFMTITVANPAIPLGGFLGESKSEILANLSGPYVLPHASIPAGPFTARLGQLEVFIESQGGKLPIVLKPDAGQRGASVKRVETMEQAVEYLASHPGSVLAQVFHPGPFEAGIFYYRLPGEARGRIFSITDKNFPHVTGDGRSTLEQLILRHPRYRMQAGVFLARHHDRHRRVLPAGQLFALAMAGNHCQGTMFRDGSHLLTPRLEEAIDHIAKRFEGFYFGRFDVRYSDVEVFKAGKDIAVVELNGVASESTNLYDPAHSLWRAYSILIRQWSLLFEIGRQNRRLGHKPASFLTLLKTISSFYLRSPCAGISD